MQLNLTVSSADEARIAIRTLGQYIAACEAVAKRADLEKLTIDDIGLSTYTSNVLRLAGVFSLAELIRENESSLRKLDRMGTKGVADVKAALERQGLTLGMALD